jgi:hypothetical protein
MYVIVGEPCREFIETPYSTDPRSYGLPLFKRPISDEEFERDYRTKVKAFLNREHAIEFAYNCNLVGVQCPVYDRIGDEWEYNSDEAGRVADDIN